MTEQITIRARVTDLWSDGFGGWSENASWCRSVELRVSADLSDAAISRRIKAALGIQGMRTDPWCCSDFGPWRDGAVGAYADILY